MSLLSRGMAAIHNSYRKLSIEPILAKRGVNNQTSENAATRRENQTYFSVLHDCDVSRKWTAYPVATSSIFATETASIKISERWPSIIVGRRGQNQRSEREKNSSWRSTKSFCWLGTQRHGQAQRQQPKITEEGKEKTRA